MELDHVFILCALDAPGAAALTRIGLTEGPPNRHPGQGTACRRFLFQNAYVELLWVHDEREAQNQGVQRTKLWERWSGRGETACPFGVVLRPNDDELVVRPPFPTWAYGPGYLPAGLAIDVALNTPLIEPEFFYLGFQRGRSRRVLELVSHPIGAKEITDVSIGAPAPCQSAAAALATEDGVVSFESSSEYVMNLTLDGATSGKTADLRPDLPLVLRW